MQPGIQTLVLTFASLAIAGQISVAQQPDWTLYRPGNTGIPGDYTQTIFVDENDLPWVAAYTTFYEEGGMAHWDGGSLWTAVSSADHPTIVSPRFSDIIKDPATGLLWIASDHGLLSFDPAIGPESLVRYDHNNSPLPISQLRDLHMDPDGAIWIAVHDVNDAPPGCLARFDPATGGWDIWTTDNGLPWWDNWDWVDFVTSAPDPDGGFTVFFGSSEMGTATYKDGQFSWYGNDYDPNLPTFPRGVRSKDAADELGNIWMLTNHGLARRAPDGSFLVTGYPANLSSEVAVVTAISGGRALLGTYYSDVYIWDEGWTYIGNWASGVPGGGSHTYTFAEDSQGNFWTGGIGGAAKYTDGSWQRYRATNTGMIGYFIDSIDFDDAGRVLMNGNASPGIGGFNVFDGTNWIAVTDANYGIAPPWGHPSDESSAICSRANGNIVVAPNFNGLFDWDPESYVYTELLPAGYAIDNVEEDTLGRVWAARENGYGLFRITGTDSVQYVSGQSPLLGGEIHEIVVDHENDGFVWLSSLFGILHTDGDTWNAYPTELFGPDYVTDFALDPDGTFWVGTGAGLVHYDPDTGSSDVYTTANSAMVSDVVRHVTLGSDGSVWVSTRDFVWPYPGGVTHFKDGVSTTYDTDNSPLPHLQHLEMISRAVPGGYEVWLGTVEAIAVIHMSTGLLADLNGDGQVNTADLLELLGQWGRCNGCSGDLNADGMIDISDILLLLSQWT